MKITDEMLRSAASAYNAAVVLQAEKIHAEAQPHVFSPEFDERIRQLADRTERSVGRQVLKWAAAILVTLMMTGATWLALDTQARAEFIGWVKELFDNNYSYSYTGEPTTSDYVVIEYELSWLPEGYQKVITAGLDDMPTFIYQNELGEHFQFAYIKDPESMEWLIDVDFSQKIQVNIHGYPADLFLPVDSLQGSVIVWSEGDIAFMISGKLTKEELLCIAENVTFMNFR